MTFVRASGLCSFQVRTRSLYPEQQPKTGEAKVVCQECASLAGLTRGLRVKREAQRSSGAISASASRGHLLSKSSFRDRWS